MESLLSNLVPLALGSAISPVVLTVVILTLSGKVAPLKRGLMLICGGSIPLAVVAVVGLVSFGSSQSGQSQGKSEFSAIIDIVIGVLLFLVGIRALLREPTPKKVEESQSPEPLLKRYFTIGIAMMASNVTTLILYIAELKWIARAHLSSGEYGLGVAIAVIFALLPAWLPLIGYATSPSTAEKILTPINHFFTKNTRKISIVLALGFGVYLLVKGISEL